MFFARVFFITLKLGVFCVFSVGSRWWSGGVFCVFPRCVFVAVCTHTWARLPSIVVSTINTICMSNDGGGEGGDDGGEDVVD